MGIAVLDVGTSSMRGILYDDKGQKLFTKQVEYTPIYLEHDWVEQNPSDWKCAMEVSMKACAVFAKERGENIRAVSLTSQRSSVIPIGKGGTPVGNAIMWQDKRVLEVLKELSPCHSRIFQLTGSRVNPVFSGSKMMWIRKCSPHLYEQAERLVVIPDYLIHEMTGNWVTDATYGSRSLLMNLRTRQWDDELLELFQVEKEKLCSIIEPGSIAGRVSQACSRVTGLEEGTPVITAGGDQQCAALGMGMTRQGAIEVSAGTGAYIIGALKRVPDHLEEDVICNASAIPGEYVLESSILSCASVFNWILRLCYGMNGENRKETYQIVNREVEESLKKEDDLMMLPFFQGRGTPDWNSKARGCFHNLTLGTEPGDMARAVMEGLGYEISANIDRIKNYVGEIENIYACGGLVNSPVFGRILASICNSGICTYQDNEAAAIGAWMSAGVELGLYPDYDSAFWQGRQGHPVNQIEADCELKKRYGEGKEKYSQLYSRLYGKALERQGGNG